jgi:hypothetical protein
VTIIASAISFELFLSYSASMKAFAFATIVTGILAQEFEPVDFNVTEALLNNGVDVAAIPELSPSSAGTLSSSCSAAVSS